MVRFTYDTVAIRDIKVETEESENPANKMPVVSAVRIDGERYKPSKRFWTSMGARFGIPRNVYKYFPYDEVFNRISEVETNDRIRIAVEHKGSKKKLLAATNPSKPLVGYNSITDLLEEQGNVGVNYHEGVVTSTHRVRNDDGFSVLGESYENRFTMETPIDGYGLPNIYLSLLREVCANGMVGYSKAFRTSLQIGKGEDDVRFSLARSMDSFNNEEGFSALRDRLEAAGNSWASLYEALKLSQILYRARAQGALGEKEQAIEVMKRYYEVVGDMVQHYGIVQLESLTQKKMRNLPSRATVYQIINFATETATHHCNEFTWQKEIQAYCGTLISQEYDLEGTKLKYQNFEEFFLN